MKDSISGIETYSSEKVTSKVILGKREINDIVTGCVGDSEGDSDGNSEGTSDGASEGESVGLGVGSGVGRGVGRGVGGGVGGRVGRCVGRSVGSENSVGGNVGLTTTASIRSSNSSPFTETIVSKTQTAKNRAATHQNVVFLLRIIVTWCFLTSNKKKSTPPIHRLPEKGKRKKPARKNDEDITYYSDDVTKDVLDKKSFYRICQFNKNFSVFVPEF